MTKNILFVSHSAELNGAELMLLQTLERLNKQKYCPVLIIPRHGPLENRAKSLGIETEIVSMKWWLTERIMFWKQPFAWVWNIFSVMKIARLIQQRKIVLVFSNSGASFSGAIAARLRKVPHIWMIHELLSGKNAALFCVLGKRFVIKTIKSLSSFVVVNSKATQQPFGHGPKLRLIYNGIGIPLESNVEQSGHDYRKEFGWEDKNIILGVVGKIRKEKGQGELIQAMPVLKKIEPGLRLLFVGTIVKRRFYKKLNNLVEKFGLEKMVFFTGRREDVPNLMLCMDILVVPSKSESFGRVIIEAMSIGTPVLAVESGGIPEIIDDGKNGFLMRSNKPVDIASALKPILHDPEKTAAVALEAKKMVQEKFSLYDQVRFIESVIEECFE